MKTLNRIAISGYRSFSAQRPIDLTLGRINVFLGANGAGKSNLLSFLAMLTSINNRTFQAYVAHAGVQTLLHGGAQCTGSIKSLICCEDNLGQSRVSEYRAALNFGIPGRLFVAEETLKTSDRDVPYMIYSDSNESGLQSCLQDPGAKLVADVLSRIYFYQLNNTVLSSPIRSASGLYDCAVLRWDGGNLAAYLYQLASVERYRPYYARIVAMIRSVMPQFNDFSLTPTADKSVWLTWTDRAHPGYLLGPHQLSDGALRFMALTTVLLSPPDLMPCVLVLDEPELGLHPLAIAKLAGMIKMAAVNSQVLVATQSAKLVDGFSIADVKIVDWNRQHGCSEVKSLDPETYRQWLENYNSISDLWEKNLIGGQP